MSKKGFTLIELLIVITIITILSAVIFVAVDPAKRFADARNAVRWSDVTSVLDAILKYQVDNNGSLPTGIDSVTGSSQVLGTNGSGCDSGCTNADGAATVAACLDLTSDLVDDYLAAIPEDPSTGSAGFTDYYINKTTNGRLEVGACDPEEGATIEVKR